MRRASASLNRIIRDRALLLYHTRVYLSTAAMGWIHTNTKNEMRKSKHKNKNKMQ